MATADFNLFDPAFAAIEAGVAPLEAFRTSRQLSASDVATMSGVAVERITLHERGGKLTDTEITALADALDLPEIILAS